MKSSASPQILSHLLVLTATALAVGVGCPKQPTVAREAGPLVEPRSAVDLEPARETLEHFLQARWSFDEDAALDYVTAEDRENTWPLAFAPFAHRFAPGRDDFSAWYDWRIVDLEAIDDAHAVANVEVVLPTVAETLRWRTLLPMDRMRFMTGSGSRREQLKRMSTFPEVAVPARRVVTMKYHLVVESDLWRVKMGWKHFPQPQAPRRHPSAEKEKPTTDFVGSEKWWIEQQRAQRETRDVLEPEQRGLLEEIEEAEAHLRERDFDEAIARYERLAVDPSAPDFVAQRLKQVREQRKWWEGLMADVDVEFNATAASSDQGRVMFDVSAKNIGSNALSFLAVKVFFDSGEVSGPGRMTYRALAAGEKLTKQMKVYVREESTVPRVVELRITDVRFVSDSLGREHRPPNDTDFRRKLQEFRTGGASATGAGRLMVEVRGKRDEFDSCTGWPSEPFDVRVDVDTKGVVQNVDVRHEGASPELLSCLSELFRSFEFGESEEDWAAVVQLIPPAYWRGE